jgi:hypothetical protein
LCCCITLRCSLQLQLEAIAEVLASSWSRPA